MDVKGLSTGAVTVFLHVIRPERCSRPDVLALQRRCATPHPTSLRRALQQGTPEECRRVCQPDGYQRLTSQGTRKERNECYDRLLFVHLAFWETFHQAARANHRAMLRWSPCGYEWKDPDRNKKLRNIGSVSFFRSKSNEYAADPSIENKFGADSTAPRSPGQSVSGVLFSR